MLWQRVEDEDKGGNETFTPGGVQETWPLSMNWVCTMSSRAVTLLCLMRDAYCDASFNDISTE